MDPALYNEVYGDGIDKEVIPEYVKYLEPCHLYCIIENHVWRVGSEARNWEKAFIIKIN